jgi:hypothetical protein
MGRGVRDGECEVSTGQWRAWGSQGSWSIDSKKKGHTGSVGDDDDVTWPGKT